jgi:hypothetical protein
MNPKLNVWCTFSHHVVSGPFQEETLNSSYYLDMLITVFAVLQMIHLHMSIFFQQDGTPPHWSLAVQEFLDEILPE